VGRWPQRRVLDGFNLAARAVALSDTDELRLR